MTMSPYYRALRARTGPDLLLMPAVAAVIRDDQGRLLVQRTQQGEWSLPAGAIEPGEAPARAVAREVHEETGLQVRPARVLGVVGGENCRVTYPSGDRVEYIVTVFECHVVTGSLIDSNDETASLHWFKLDELPKLAFPYPDEVLRSESPLAHFEWDDAWASAP
ncbi:MAG: NUDIX domain-containing protein [Polyangiaceae bacterium]